MTKCFEEKNFPHYKVFIFIETFFARTKFVEKVEGCPYFLYEQSLSEGGGEEIPGLWWKVSSNLSESKNAKLKKNMW